jgi:hypothetical protein
VLKAHASDQIYGKTSIFNSEFIISLAGFFIPSIRAGQFFEVVGILNRRGDFVLSACPFTEVQKSATVRTEGKILVRGEDNFAAGRTEESFWHCFTS